MPWKNGCTLVWDGTCLDMFTPSHMALAAREAGLVTSQAEKAKIQKYALFESSHHVIPVAIKTSGVFRPEAISLIKKLEQRTRAERQAALPAVPVAGLCSSHSMCQCCSSDGHLTPHGHCIHLTIYASCFRSIYQSHGGGGFNF